VVVIAWVLLLVFSFIGWSCIFGLTIKFRYKVVCVGGGGLQEVACVVSGVSGESFHSQWSLVGELVVRRFMFFRRYWNLHHAFL
jgi:hypothetical protein